MIYRIRMNPKLGAWYIQIKHIPLVWENIKEDDNPKATRHFADIKAAYAWVLSVGLESMYQDVSMGNPMYQTVDETRLQVVKNALRPYEVTKVAILDNPPRMPSVAP